MIDGLNLRGRILGVFPARTRALTLVRDPDGLLSDEATLAERGFCVVAEVDPVELRHRVELARPWVPERPLLVVKEGQLNELPYDLWQQGHRVELALHTFFPNLDYPTVRALSPEARARLGRALLPATRLGPRTTVQYMLRHAYQVKPEMLGEPVALVTWLTDYHRLADPMPPALAEELLASLRLLPAYSGWDLDRLLGDEAAFTRFVQDQWRGYVGAQIGRQLTEEPTPYLLGFGVDSGLQDDLARLVRTGVLEPVTVEDPGRLPSWTRPAIVAPDEDRRSRRVHELCALLDGELAALSVEARWGEWQAIARAWAELQTLRDAGDQRLESGQATVCAQIGATVDAGFASWLRRSYAPLAVKRVPVPHHVFHVPEFIAYWRRQGHTDRIALLVLDGLALRDWLLIGEAWRARHPEWRFAETLLLAQIPTITAISRQALVAGSRPLDFGETIRHNRAEPRLWTAFWTRQDSPLAEDGCTYLHLGDEAESPAALLGPRVSAACLVETSIDEIIHGASLGAADVQSSMRLWLDRVSPRVEAALGNLLGRGFTVFVASDHGHVEALGIGQPMEGVNVETRGRRARTYRDRRLAETVQERFPKTELWSQDGLLPDDLWAVMPLGRTAFARHREQVVTHGGPSLDEVVVPFVTITAS